MIIRAKTFRDWLRANLSKGQLEDLANQGAQRGFPGLTYYRDICELYAKFRVEIWGKLGEIAEEVGYPNTWAMIGEFSTAGFDDANQAENLLVWAVAEEYARELTERSAA